MKIKTLAVVLGIALALLAIAGGAISTTVGESRLHAYLEKTVREGCGLCREFSIGSLEISADWKRLQLRDLHLRYGTLEDEEYEFWLPYMEIVWQPSSAWRAWRKKGPVVVQRIRLAELRVEVREYNETKPMESGGKGLGAPPIIVEAMGIENAQFTYIRQFRKRAAPLHLQQINVTAKPLRLLGTEDQERWWIETQALLENSGKVDLRVGILLAAPQTDLNLYLRVRSQALAQLNPYFEAGETVKLGGELVDGVAELKVEGKALRGTVGVTYRDLAIEKLKTPQDEGIGLFLTNVVLDVKLNPTNAGEPALPKTAPARERWTGDESIFKLLLRGMLNGAIKVAGRWP